MKSRFAALAVAAFVVASSAHAQEGAVQYDGDARNVLVGSNTLDPSASTYVQPRSTYTGIANLWMRGDDPGNGVLGGCTGNLLWTGRHILTAAHCVSTGTNSILDPFGTARFRTSTGWRDVNWSSAKVQAGYSGGVIEEQDVAILTLDETVESAFERYTLHSGSVLGEKARLGGYGRIGSGLTGDAFSSGQFGDGAELRTGFNLFESTCLDGGICMSAAGTPETFGGVLLADMDISGQNTGGFMCQVLGFCSSGYDNFEEAGVGRGDSGSGAFSVNSNGIMGVASWGTSADGANIGQFGEIFGYACVAGGTGNAACQANYDFVMSTVPEPSSVALLTTSLLALGLVARRRRTR